MFSHYTLLTEFDDQTVRESNIHVTRVHRETVNKYFNDVL